MEEILKAIQAQLASIEASLTKVGPLAERVDKFVADLAEFSERFEEVVQQLADERRLDLLRDYE